MPDEWSLPQQVVSPTERLASLDRSVAALVTFLDSFKDEGKPPLYVPTAKKTITDLVQILSGKETYVGIHDPSKLEDVRGKIATLKTILASLNDPIPNEPVPIVNPSVVDKIKALF